MDLPAANRKEVYVPPEESERMLQHARDSNLRDLFVTTYEIACRPQESLRVERRRVDLEHQRWAFPSSEAKGKSAPRIVYLIDKAMEITRRLMLQYPEGALFRSSRGKPWTPDSVNSAVDRIRIRMGRAEMKRVGRVITNAEIDSIARSVNPVAHKKGEKIRKTKWRIREQARRKLLLQRARQLVPRYSLYALRWPAVENLFHRL